MLHIASHQITQKNNTETAFFDESGKKKFSDNIIKILEQDLMPKVFQRSLISFLKNKRMFNADYLSCIKSMYLEAEKARDQLLESVCEPDVPGTEIDCQKGCFHCCGMVVKPLAPEMYLILESLMSSYSRDQLEQLVKDLKVKVSEIKACDSVKKRVKAYCIFLKDNSCGIYENRPLACRAYTSTDVEVCKSFAENPVCTIPSSICHDAPYSITRKAIQKSLYIAGLKQVTEELNSGILRLLEGELELTTLELNEQ